MLFASMFDAFDILLQNASNKKKGNYLETSSSSKTQRVRSKEVLQDENMPQEFFVFNKLKI